MIHRCHQMSYISLLWRQQRIDCLLNADAIKCFRAAKESMERLEKELCDERERTGLIQKQKEEAEWSLGEHRQWLQDANNRYTLFVLLGSTSVFNCTPSTLSHSFFSVEFNFTDHLQLLSLYIITVIRTCWLKQFFMCCKG